MATQPSELQKLLTNADMTPFKYEDCLTVTDSSLRNFLVNYTFALSHQGLSDDEISAVAESMSWFSFKVLADATVICYWPGVNFVVVEPV